jgi:hypothetical protein
MIAYGIGFLRIIQKLKEEFPDVMQHWYVDDAGAAAKFSRIKQHFKRLQKIGPSFGYFPDPSKIIIVTSSDNVVEAKIFLADLDFKIVTGKHYLGGYLGEEKGKKPG